MSPEPRKISVEDTARALLETALMAFAAREDVYVPRRTDLAEFLWLRAVYPLLADLQGSTPAVDPSHGNVAYCPDMKPHGTHIWDADFEGVTVVVRCPGRET